MKKSMKKHWNWSWIGSQHFWLAFGGLVFTAILVVEQEQWGGILAVTCFATSLGIRIVDRMPRQVPTPKSTVPTCVAGQMKYVPISRKET